MPLVFTTSQDEGFTVEEIAARAIRARLYRKEGLMRGWLYHPEVIEHIVLVDSGAMIVTNKDMVGVGMIHEDRTVSLFVKGYWRKQGIGETIIQKLLSMDDKIVYGKPDWDRPWDYNAKFWDKMKLRYPDRIRLA